MVDPSQLGVDLQADVADGLLVQLLGRGLEHVVLEEALGDQTKLHVAQLFDFSIQETSLKGKGYQQEIHRLAFPFEVLNDLLELLLQVELMKLIMI